MNSPTEVCACAISSKRPGSYLANGAGGLLTKMVRIDRLETRIQYQSSTSSTVTLVSIFRTQAEAGTLLRVKCLKQFLEESKILPGKR